MKTTVEISDGLLIEARKVAAREGVTLRSLIERGLRHALNQRKQQGHFRLRKVTFKGRGIRMSIVAAAEHAARESNLQSGTGNCDRLLELVGQAGRIGRKDVSRRHDAYLGEAKRKRGL